MSAVRGSKTPSARLRAATFALLLCAPVLLAAARAEEYPSRPITLVVPYTPGGGVDLLARALAPRLEAMLGTQVIVDNRPGAGGSVGAAFVAHAAPDGYTLLLSTSAPLTTNLALYPAIGYDTLRDFAPIIVTGSAGSVIAVNPKLPAKTFAELVALAKKEPGTLAAATSGNGSTSDLTVAEVDRVAHVDIRTVPYRGGVPSLAAAMSGEVPIVFSDVKAALPYLQSGKLRALAVTTPQRDRLVPGVPTVAESGYPGFDVAGWLGLVAPHGTPAPIVQKLYASVARIIKARDFPKELVNFNVPPSGYDPERFKAFLAGEIPRWKRMVQESNLQIH